jgi:hypothetical protein
MKYSTLVILILLLPVLCVPAYATIDADSVLIIPHAKIAPTIDGVFDTGSYHNGTMAYIRVNDESMDPPDDWFDNYGTFWAVWNDNYLYLYISVMDDIIDTNTASGAHENDGAEIYFDGNWSQGDAYDGEDDSQIRFNWDETEDRWDETYEDLDFTDNEIQELVLDQIEFMFTETDLGYDLEVMFPIAELGIINDSEFGFDIQFNENDSGGRDGMLRWWNNNNNSWNNASVFGTARLTNRTVSSTLDVNEIASAPTIDGEIDNVWYTIPIFGQGTYVTEQAGEELDPPFYTPDDWDDLLMQYRVAYDAYAMYLLVEVTDDVPGEVVDEAWLSDGIEIYVDANYSQEGNTDAGNENYQWRWVYGQETGGLTNGVAAWYDTYLGYNIEIELPWGDMPFSPDAGHTFGWDIQINDCDGDPDIKREHMARWWSNDNNEWQDFSLCGTAQIGALADVQPLANRGIVTKFELAQNYPNPFNPMTTIAYSVTGNDHVSLRVFNVLGERVATLVNEMQTAGTYSVSFNGSDLSSGIYLYRIQSGRDVITRKMMLVK